MFQWGTSSVKGFATTLIISILLSFLTAVWGSRVLLGLLVNSGYFNSPAWFGIAKSKQHSLDENIGTLDLSTKFDRFDFVHNRKKFYTFSLAILVAGIVVLGIFRLNLGIDFSSGTRVQIESNQTLTKEEVSKYLDSIDFSSEDIILSGEKSNTAVIRYKDDLTQAEILEFKKKLAKNMVMNQL